MEIDFRGLTIRVLHFPHQQFVAFELRDGELENKLFDLALDHRARGFYASLSVSF